MSDETCMGAILTGLTESDGRELAAALASQGRSSAAGDPAAAVDAALVFAGVYEEKGLRSQRAAAMDDKRPWCFCVHGEARALVAQAALAREGKLLLLPPEARELKRLLAVLDDEARDRGSGDAAFLGLGRLEAEFVWRTDGIDISHVSRRIARLLAETGFYGSRSAEDECALALEEALVNSVEHGNLGLDSSLRPDDPLQEDAYEAERARRLAEPDYGGRLVRMSIGIGGEEAVIGIEDEGPGFDTSRIDDSPSGLEVSGKGFWLIKQPFDGAEYNRKGNKLTLRRRRPKASGQAR